MARVTVEDCVDKIPNRFDLVVLASHRARELSEGSHPTVSRDNDKNPVIALREISEKTQNGEELRERLIAHYQQHIEVDRPEDDDLAVLMGEVTDDVLDTTEISEQDMLEALRASDKIGPEEDTKTSG